MTKDNIKAGFYDESVIKRPFIIFNPSYSLVSQTRPLGLPLAGDLWLPPNPPCGGGRPGHLGVNPASLPPGLDPDCHRFRSLGIEFPLSQFGLVSQCEEGPRSGQHARGELNIDVRVKNTCN